MLAAALLLRAAATVHPADDPPPDSVPIDYLNELLVDQWVCCDPLDRLAVQLVSADGSRPVAGAGVDVLLIRQAQIIQAAAPDLWGRVLFEAVTPGVYQLLVDSPSCFAQLPISVIARASAIGLPESVRLPVIAPYRATVTDRVLSQTIPWVDSLTPSVFEHDPLRNRRLPGATVIEATDDGSLVGRLALLGVPLSQNAMAGMHMALISDGRIVVERPIDDSGHFRVESLPPDCYGLVAFGPQGGVATSFRFVPHRRNTPGGEPTSRWTTALAPATSLNLECYPLSFNPAAAASPPDLLGRGLGTGCGNVPIGPLRPSQDRVMRAIRQTEGFPINVSGGAGEFLLIMPLFEEAYVPHPVWLPPPIKWP